MPVEKNKTERKKKSRQPYSIKLTKDNECIPRQRIPETEAQRLLLCFLICRASYWPAVCVYISFASNQWLTCLWQHCWPPDGIGQADREKWLIVSVCFPLFPFFHGDFRFVQLWGINAVKLFHSRSATAGRAEVKLRRHRPCFWIRGTAKSGPARRPKMPPRRRRKKSRPTSQRNRNQNRKRNFAMIHRQLRLLSQQQQLPPLLPDRKRPKPMEIIHRSIVNRHCRLRRRLLPARLLETQPSPYRNDSSADGQLT